MASYVKFQTFIEQLSEQGHNLGSDTIRAALTNTAPTVATDTVFDPVTLHPPPAAANGYTSGGATLTHVTSAQTGGTYKLVLNDALITATAGGIGPFRYVIIYNDTSATDLLIAYYDYGSSITLVNADETFTINCDGSTGIIQIT
jgi:hypothetical protein